MRTQTRVLTGVAASLAVSALITCIVYFVIRDMDSELARGRVYEEIMSKTHALNLVTAKFRSEPDPSRIRQIRAIQGSLENLLGALTYLDAREESLVRQIRTSSKEAGYSLERLISSHLALGVGMETERYNVLVSQLSMKTQFISDDTQRLMGISRSRIAAAQAKAGISILALIVALVLINGAISFFSGRSIARMQDGLQEQRKWLQVTLSSIGDGVIATDTASKIAFLNPVAAALTGWPIEQALGRPAQDLFRIINEKTREPGEDIVSRVLHEGGSVALANDTVLVARDGREIPIEDSAALIRDATGKVAGVVLVFHDVTEKRRDRKALRESEEHFRALAESLPQIVWTADADGRIEWFNQRWYEYTGESQRVGENWSWDKVAHPDDMAHTLKNWEEARQRGVLFQNEIRLRGHERQYRWFLVRGWPLRDAAGKVVRWFGTDTDVHDMKAAEAALRQIREDLDRAQEVGQIGSWRLDVRRNALTWSDENHRIFGVPKGTPMTYETFQEIVHPDDRQHLDTQWKAGLAGEPYDVEHRIVVGRQVKWVREKAYLEFDDAGELLGGFGITQDITERKRTEEALRESRAKLEAALASMTDAVFISDREGHFIEFNDAFATFHRFRDKDECSKTFAEYPDILDVFMASGELASLDQWAVPRALRGETVTNAEYTLRRKDTGETWVGSYSFAPIRDKDGVIVGSVVVGRDITKQKQAEEAIRASLGEKEVLLKEIHHRVKNNMQVISSLVALQADGLQDEATRAVLQDITHRVRSMALVHEKLYQSADLARVEFAEYARSLLNYLWRAHGTAASGTRLTLDLEPVSLPINAAVPCGLILNELASNALKHAFRGRGHAEGEVTVSLRRSTQGEVRLGVRDNGTGLPAGFDWSQARTLGLRLVQMLAGQLHAAVEVSSVGGTEFKISFERAKE